MPGPAPKRAENRSRRPRGASLTVMPPSKSRIAKPKPPDGLLESIGESWEAFWASPLAQHTITSDLPALRRLFRLYHQREVYLTAGSEESLTRGSTGQMTLNPLLKEVDALDAKILALEDRFGLSPMARLKLQVTFGDASRSIAEVNAALAAPIAAEEDPDDPRLVGLAQ